MKRINPFIRQFGVLRLIAFVLAALPLILLPVLGMIWLWESDKRLYWMLGLVGCGLSGYCLHLLLRYRERKQITGHETHPSPMWPPSADECWNKVETLAREVSPQKWPVNDVEKLALLGRNTLEIVARHYYPDRDEPLLELTIPHALLIIEMAGSDLRKDIIENVPFSHRLSIGTLMRANRWLEIIKPYETWYRAIRSVVDPTSAIFKEIRRAMGKNIMDHGFEMMKTWLLREYVRKTGYYAIQLYSGQLLVSGKNPLDDFTSPARPDDLKVDTSVESETEPLRILVLGRANAGKSSLINALFGKLTTATDVLLHTTEEMAAYCLEHDGCEKALIFDAPGFDTELLGEKALRKAVLQADLILWVTAANRPDRQVERKRLGMIRAWFLQKPSRRPPPILAVVTHIDQLRPPRQWDPPYDLNNPRDKKAENIAAAVATVASDLNIPPSLTVPVCLAPDRLYNVEDTLWAAILNQQDDAGKARFLRCLESRRKKEDWALFWKQLAGGGRVLAKIPERIFSSTTIQRGSKPGRQN